MFRQGFQEYTLNIILSSLFLKSIKHEVLGRKHVFKMEKPFADRYFSEEIKSVMTWKRISNYLQI